MKTFKLNVLQLVAVGALVGGLAACGSEQKVQRPRIEVTMAPLGVGEGSVPIPAIPEASQFDDAGDPVWTVGRGGDYETAQEIPKSAITDPVGSAWDGSYADLLAYDAYVSCTQIVPGKFARFLDYGMGANTTGEEFAHPDEFIWRIFTEGREAHCPKYPTDVDFSKNPENGDEAIAMMQPWLNGSRLDPTCNIDPITGEAASYEVVGLSPGTWAYDTFLVLWTRFPENLEPTEVELEPVPSIVGDSGPAALARAQNAMDYASLTLCMARRMNEHLSSQQVVAMQPDEVQRVQSIVHERAQSAVAQYSLVLKAMVEHASSAASNGELIISSASEYPLVLGRYYGTLLDWTIGDVDWSEVDYVVGQAGPEVDYNGDPWLTGLERIAVISRDYADAIGLLASSTEAMGKHVLRDEGPQALAALLHGPNTDLPAFAESGFDGPGAEALLSLARGADALKFQVETYACANQDNVLADGSVVGGTGAAPCFEKGAWGAIRVRESAVALYDAVELELRSRECDMNLESDYCDIAALPGVLGGSYLAASEYGASLDDAKNVVSTLAELIFGPPTQRNGDNLFYLVDGGSTISVAMVPSVYLSSTLSGKHQMLANTPQIGTDTLHIDRNFDYRSAMAADTVTKGGLLDVVTLPGSWAAEPTSDEAGFGFRGLWQNGRRPVGAISVLAAARSLTQSMLESSVPTELTDSFEAAMPLLQAMLGDEMIQVRVIETPSDPTKVNACAYIYQAEPDDEVRWAFEYIADGLEAPLPPAYPDVDTDALRRATGTTKAAPALGDSYLEVCADGITTPINQGQGLALIRFEDGASFGRRVFTVSADILGTSTVSGLPPVFVVSDGSLQQWVNRVFRASKKNWAKRRYDPLGLPTDWNPTASAELFGGGESEEAYRYFLRAAKEAGKEATAATEKAFANLRQQEVDDLALEQAEEKGAGLRTLEVLATCGKLPCDPGVRVTKHYNFFSWYLGRESDCFYTNPNGFKVNVCDTVQGQVHAGLQAFGSPHYGISLPAVVVDALNVDPLHPELSSSHERSLASYSGTTVGAVLEEVFLATDALRVGLQQTRDAAVKGAADMRVSVAGVASAQLNADATCLDAELGFASGMLEHDRFMAGIGEAKNQESLARVAKIYACGFAENAYWAARTAAVGLCSSCFWAEYTDNETITPEHPEDGFAFWCPDADHGMLLNTPSHHFYWTIDMCVNRESTHMVSSTGWSRSEAFHAHEACAAASAKLNADDQLPAKLRQERLVEDYLARLGETTELQGTNLHGQIVEDKLRAQWVRRCDAAISQRTVAVEQEVASYHAVVGSGVAAVQVARAASDRLLKALEAWRFTVRQAWFTQAKLHLEQSLETAQIDLRFDLKRKYNSYDLWRARALSENARRLAVAARRSIEGRFVVDLSDLHAPEPFVESPAIWADEIYASDLKPPAALGRTSGAAAVSGAVYSSAIEDYVTNLDLFVKGYAVARPTSIAKRDTEVIQLPAPAGVATAVTSGGGYSYVDPNSAQWSFYCPKQNAWISNPHMTEFGLTDASLSTACGDSPPTRARLGFWLDPWGRYNGDFNSLPPYALRHNTRWQKLAINLVGTGVRDCSKAQDPLVCYAEPFIRYNLRHVGPAVVSDYQGTFKTLTIPSAVIEGGKALASEQWVDPVTQGFQSTSVANVARYEYAGRPLGGTYELMLELTPDVRLERIQRIQLVAQTDYWVRQLGSDKPVDPTLLVSQCGNGILEADETCEMVINGVAPTAESDAGVGAPICPASCDDNDPATLDVTGGVAALCTSTCEHQLIDRCLSGDGFCPPSCTSSEDSDCNTGTLVSWVSSGDYVTDTNVTAEPRFGWVPGASLLEGNRDLLNGEIAPFGTSDVPVLSYDAGAGRETFVQIEGARTNLSPLTSGLTPRMVGVPELWINGAFEVVENAAPGMDGALEADEIGFVQTGDMARFATEPLTEAGAHTLSVFYRNTGEPARWRYSVGRQSGGAWSYTNEFFTAEDAWVRADVRRFDFDVADALELRIGTDVSKPELGTGPVLFDMWQVEAGAFPSSPITTAGATRPENHLRIAAPFLPEVVRSGQWSFRFVPYFASDDVLDGGAAAKAHVLSFNDGSNGLTVSLQTNVGSSGKIAIESMDGNTTYHSTNLPWARYDTLEVSFDFVQDRVLVHNLTAEAEGDVPAGPAVAFTGSPTIQSNFAMWVGKQAANESTEFFGLVSQPKATQFSDGTGELSAEQLCGNGQFESVHELCDDSAGWAHTCPLAWDCDDGNTCTADTVVDGVLSGATACRTHCSNAVVDVCDLTPDGCCPAGCNETTDGDCHTPLASWSDVTFTNLSLGERQIWDTGTHHMFGPFGPGTPALVQLVGRRYVQVEGTRTNLISENRDPSAWFTTGWECADCGPALAPTPYGGLGNTELRGTALQPFLGDESGVTTQEILSGTVLEYLVPSQTRTGFVVTCGLQDVNPGVNGLTEVFPPDQDQYGSANMGSWRRREGEVSDCSVWPAGSVDANGVDYSGMTLLAMHPRSAPLSAADEGGGRIADFLQLEAGAFPSSPIDSASGQTRYADHVLVRAPDVSPLLREGRWAISLIPEHSSVDLVSHGQNATILTFADSSDPHILVLSIALLPDGTLRVLDEESGVELIRTAPLTWSRNVPLELVFDPLAGAVTLSGFDSGDGYVAGSPWAVRSDTDLYVGTLVDTDHFFGLISEPWQVPYAQGDAPYCGDNIVEADETCDGDCHVGICATNPGANCACDDQNACTVGDTHVSGTVAACDLVCDYPITITSCIDGDGCCPAGCNDNSDLDCAPPKLIFGNRLMSWHRADRGVELDPSSGEVLAWADQGPRGNDLTALTSSAYAGMPALVTSGTGMFNGQPFLEFKHDERDVLSDLAPDWPGLDEPQIYAVMRLTNTTLADTTGRYFLWKLQTINASDAAQVTQFYTYHQAAYGMLSQFFQSGSTVTSLNAGYNSHFGQHEAWQLMSIGLSNEEVEMRLDDGTVSAQAGPFEQTFEYSGVPKGKFLLGANSEHGNWGGAEVSSAADVNIAELMILEGRPSPAEESELRAYLNSRYGTQW